jgi:hypothetical protein
MSTMKLPEMAEQKPEVRRILEDRTLGHTEAFHIISNSYGSTSPTSVRRYRSAIEWIPAEDLHTEPDKGEDVIKGNAEVTSTGVTFQGVELENFNCQTAKDWTPIFEIFQLDPDEFEIVDDTVKIGTWQQSKALEDGTRDKVQLFSHSARFRRRSKTAISDEQRALWRTELVLRLNDLGPKYARYAEDAGTYLMLISDPQLGKKGTEEAVYNWKRGVLGHIKAIKDLQSSNRGPAAIHLAWEGDETEGVCNNYPGQAFTIEMNLTGQLGLDYDLRMWTLREASTLGLPMSASSVISNHGEWTRDGGKDVVTTRGDNASTHIARQVAKSFKEIEPFGGPKIDWTIGGGDPGIVVTLSGKACYFSHGYIEKGKGPSIEVKTKSAIERQIIGRTDTLGDVPLWFMAHYHHFYSQEFEGRTMFACPALEAERSSEYMLNQYGVWSPPGMLGMLIGRDKKRGWSDLSIF